jgi:SAM-dependent methyltransferase
MNYREGAMKYYDLFGAKDDASFYINLAKLFDGRVLEIGVGTARLAIQLARAEIEIWGIDNSIYMLKAATANLEKESPKVKDMVHLVFADVRNFNLDMRFRLIYFPSSSFDHLLNREDQLLALKNIKRHLAIGGAYAFDITHIPKLKDENKWFVQRKALDPNNLVIRIINNVLDPDKRILNVNIWYELYTNGRMMDRYFESGEIYIHTPEGIRNLLKETGYMIEAEYGSYNMDAFTPESERLVIIAKPKNVDTLS